MLLNLADRSDPTENDDESTKLRSRPVLYLTVIVGMAVATFLYALRWDGIFACPASKDADESRYLAYCHARTFGDYDRGAFWFALEPKAREAAASADVLFLGSSRMQFGFSTPSLEQWFTTVGHDYYLLGFSHTENVTFIGPLVHNLRPRAQAYVINLDSFFVNQMTAPSHDVMLGPDASRRYASKRTEQTPHHLICSWLPGLCGNEVSYLRHRKTGQWQLGGHKGLEPSGIEVDLPANAESIARRLVIGQKFVSALNVRRECVLFTYIPTRNNERATAAALASALGGELISPQIESLHTFDGSHLDRQSAERFVKAFLEIAGSRLRQCLASKRTSPPLTPSNQR